MHPAANAPSSLPRATLAIAAALFLGAPQIAGAQQQANSPEPAPAIWRSAETDTARQVRPLAPAPFLAFSASAAGVRDSLVSLARSQVGKRYVLGGESPDRGFDCSGLIRYIVAALDIRLPRTAAQQARVGSTVPRDSSRLLPGDLVTFGKSKRISHIGIYVGEGRFVHASSKAGRVIESRLMRPNYRGVKPWRGVRRIFASDSAVEKKG